VDLTAFADALQQSGIGEWLRTSLKALPIIEAVHVMAVATTTGVLLFVPNAPTYVRNTAFGLKLAALACAGVNMAVFQFTTLRTLAKWDTESAMPLGARVAGITSILIWTSVIVFGRWIGFTKGYDFSVPDEIDFQF